MIFHFTEYSESRCSSYCVTYNILYSHCASCHLQTLWTCSTRNNQIMHCWNMQIPISIIIFTVNNLYDFFCIYLAFNWFATAYLVFDTCKGFRFCLFLLKEHWLNGISLGFRCGGGGWPVVCSGWPWRTVSQEECRSLQPRHQQLVPGQRHASVSQKRRYVKKSRVNDMHICSRNPGVTKS